MAETPALAALRTSPLNSAVLATGRLWEVADLENPDPADAVALAQAAGGATIDYAPARELGWRALVALPMVARGERVGLLYVAWETPHRTDEREQILLDLVAQHAAVSLANARMLAESAARAEALQRTEQQMVAYARDLRRAYESERQRRAEVHEAYLSTVRVLATAIETRDPYTGGHVERVAVFSVAIGRELGWKEEALGTLELGALLHDVGKIGVEDRILRKPGQLDPEEWAQMKRHPELGARLLAEVPFLKTSVGCALRHHERWSGGGYPGGLMGDAIPLEARIVAVADTCDAMTSDRPYRKGLAMSVALEEIERCSNTQFDPQVVAAFIRAVHAGTIVSFNSA
jgi:HD-GYP domain-containing protein (c-di-GMP phosphodiesterase class II)